ncbi:glycosyltransferase family 2 protein [Pedobacter alpinus]|uniref:Glycosyltransferase family 2 protein n=1 Tax=Pedobacter alpinus TaxID=1590643 RepID=A0ABW5TWD0_9SPHI
MQIELSVVMSVYNAEPFLKEAIESILNQTFKKFEFIVVNDGSTDNSLDVINSFNDDRIVLIDQENIGLSRSLNKGVFISKGKFIARMDADDISLPERFALQLDFLRKNKDYVLLGSNIYFIDIKGKILDQTNLPCLNEDMKKSLPNIKLMHSSAMFLREFFFKAGEYPVEIPKYFEDKILWNKMAEFGKIATLPDVLVKYRLVPSSIFNLSNKQVQQLKDLSNKIIKNNYLLTEYDKFSIKEITRISKNQQIGNYFLRISFMHFKHNRRVKALFYVVKSFAINPFETDTLKMFMKILLPTRLLNFYRKLKQKPL